MIFYFYCPKMKDTCSWPNRNLSKKKKVHIAYPIEIIELNLSCPIKKGTHCLQIDIPEKKRTHCLPSRSNWILFLLY